MTCTSITTALLLTNKVGGRLYIHSKLAVSPRVLSLLLDPHHCDSSSLCPLNAIIAEYQLLLLHR
jgi:hypothetical protein